MQNRTIRIQAYALSALGIISFFFFMTANITELVMEGKEGKEESVDLEDKEMDS